MSRPRCRPCSSCRAVTAPFKVLPEQLELLLLASHQLHHLQVLLLLLELLLLLMLLVLKLQLLLLLELLLLLLLMLHPRQKLRRPLGDG